MVIIQAVRVHALSIHGAQGQDAVSPLRPRFLSHVQFLHLVRQHCAGKQWEWLPWKRVFSEERALEATASLRESALQPRLGIWTSAQGRRILDAQVWPVTPLGSVHQAVPALLHETACTTLPPPVDSRSRSCGNSGRNHSHRQPYTPKTATSTPNQNCKPQTFLEAMSLFVTSLAIPELASCRSPPPTHNVLSSSASSC